MGQAMTRLKRGRHVLIPGDATTYGHVSAQHAKLWRGPLQMFLRETGGISG